jgi:hypothetical protein
METLKKIGWAPIARIVLRYLIGMGTAYAWITPEVGEEIVRDPEMQLLIETALGAVAVSLVEGFYVLAKRFGWAT